jgi:hypothetical protein
MPAKAGIQYSAAMSKGREAAAYWIIRRSLSSGARSRDPLADDDSLCTSHLAPALSHHRDV